MSSNSLIFNENNAVDTVSTVVLLRIVNAARREAGEPEVRNNVFLARVEDELSIDADFDPDGYKIFVTDVGSTPQKAYSLTHEQALLVGMRESKAVRRKVLGRLKELERLLAEKEIQPLIQALPDNHLGNETLRAMHGIYQSARAQGELDALEVLRPHLSTLYAELDNDVVDTLREAVYARIRERESFLESRKEHPLAKVYRDLAYTQRELTANTYRKRLPWTPEGLEFELKMGVEPDRNGTVQTRYRVLARD